MKTIIPAAELVTRILGNQKKREDTTYRLLSFCVLCPIDDGVLLYNTMTLELLLLSSEESDRLTELEDLISKWFLVPEEQNDHLLADQLREIADHVQNPVEHITSYTIFTTTDCNARCYYCFEQGCIRKNMNIETADRLVQYIIEHSGGEKVSLHWFGGEPLVNQEVIDVICRGLTEAGVVYRSDMTSNGYLFDETTVEKAMTFWKLNKIQITLDGTEEVYNRTKAYVYAEGNPFRRVMDNIELLLESNIRVSIRLNVGEDNWRDLLLLADQLSKRFGDRKGVFVYASPLLDQVKSETKEPAWTRTHSESLMEKYRKVRDRLTELKLYKSRHLERAFRVTHCMADNDGAVTVLPDGSLGCCEHFTEDEIFGHINSPERDDAVIAGWKEHAPKGLECSGCIYYPRCFRLKKCPSGRACTPSDREETEKQLRSQMLNEYRIYTKQQTATYEDDLTPENC